MNFRPQLKELVVDELPEVILGAGEHSFRLIFNPKIFKNCHDFDVSVMDHASRKIPVRIERWGTKMRVFISPSDENEGVCSVFLEGPDVVVAKFWFVR